MIYSGLKKIKPFFSDIIQTSKETIKKNKSSKNPFIKLIISILYVLKNTLKVIIRLFTDANFRYIIIMQLINSKNIHQTTSLTFMNRYPHIFSACSEYFREKQDLKILSFGCSTGEEVITLRKYFPNAQIIGSDINKHSLKIAKKLPVDQRIKFIYSTSRELKENGPYDAIFCMAVLQRKPHVIGQKGINNLKKIYPFEKFEQQVVELDELLTQEGLMIIHYTQYSFLDTTIAKKYNSLGEYTQDDYGLPVFDKNSELVNNPSSQNSIFIKFEN